MTDQTRCPQCGQPLPADAPQALCPACLLKRGMESNTLGDTAGPAAAWTPPTVEELAGAFAELDILGLIGRGGMGAVYKARQKELDRLVALKILPPEIGRDASFAQRFAREAQAMARLSHPNIVTIHDFGQRGGLYFFLMEYVDGLSLRGLLEAGAVSPKEALAIVPQICDALQYAHDRGIVHRDIKPENILLNRAGQVKIADFGLAKLVGLAPSAAVAATGAEKIVGTPAYMAPEQIHRPSEVDHRADIYSLGVVFYQMLTGELPRGRFEPPSHKVLIDVRLDEVVLRALEKEPARRYQQVSQVKTEVETIVSTPRDQGTPPPTAPQQGARPAAIGLMGAGVVNAITVAILGWVLAKSPFRPDTGLAELSILCGIVAFSMSGFIVWGGIRMLRPGRRFAPLAAILMAIFAVPAGLMALCVAAVTGSFGASWLVIAAPGISLSWPMVTAPGTIIGLSMGIWAWVVLRREEAAQAFEAARHQPGQRRPLRRWAKALVGLACAVVAALVGIATTVVIVKVFNRRTSRPAPPATQPARGAQAPDREAVQIATRRLEIEQEKLKSVQVLVNAGRGDADLLEQQELNVLAARVALVEAFAGRDSPAAAEARLALARRRLDVARELLQGLMKLQSAGRMPDAQVKDQELRMLQAELDLRAAEAVSQPALR